MILSITCYNNIMHELSLTRSLVAIVNEKAQTARAKRVKTISVVVGKLSNAEPHSIMFAFDAVSADTLADGAQLVIEEVSGTAKCQACGCEYEVENYFTDCPQCQSSDVVVTGGDQLLVKSIEVEH